MSKENQKAADEAKAIQDKLDAKQKAADEAKAIQDKLDAETEKIEVIFLFSPTGLFNLAYSAGETGFFPINQAAELIESGCAEFVK